MTDLKSSFPSRSDVLAVFRQELARAAAVPGLAAGPALLPRFAGYYQGLARLPRRGRRTLQRQWRRSLGGLALLLALGQAPALAATINVDGVNCTLIDAIRAANSNGFAGGCAPGSGADSIVLAANSVHTLTAVDNTTNGANGLAVVTSTITIEGNSGIITRDPSAAEFRILAVGSTGNLTVQETIISGGRATAFPFNGGGLLNYGTLTLVNSTVVGNTALRDGGGVFNYFATLRLIDSNVSGNRADDAGGGVFSRYDTLTLTNSTISGNSAARGGGVFSSSSDPTLINSTVSGNAAQFDGGGMDNEGVLTLTNSTISGNLARYGDGGGVANSFVLSLTNSTVTGNSAGQDGGGLHNVGTLRLNDTLFLGTRPDSWVRR